MRLTSDFWCSALMRRVRAEGGFAYLTRRGSSEAGTIFILFRQRNGLVDLYGPAPQSVYDERSDADERQFIKILSLVEEGEAVEKLEKELRFDADLWLIELEDYQPNDIPFLVVEML